MKVLLFFIVIIVSILFHEFGHFIVAKFLRFKIKEFSIGFGPKIYQIRYKGTDYSVRAVFMGGYVEFQDKENDVGQTSGTKYMEDIYWSRLAVTAMGVICNLLLAILAFFIFGLLNQLDFGEALYFSVKAIELSTGMTFEGMGDINNFSSVIGAAAVVEEIKLGNVDFFFYMLGLINMSLAILNFLPVPILDGGKFILNLIESIRRKIISQKAKFYINLTCWFFLMGFAIFLTGRDIINIIVK